MEDYQHVRLPTQRSFRLLEFKNKVLSVKWSLENLEIGPRPKYTALPYTGVISWTINIQERQKKRFIYLHQVEGSLRRYWSLPNSTMRSSSCNAQTTLVILWIDAISVDITQKRSGKSMKKPHCTEYCIRNVLDLPPLGMVSNRRRYILARHDAWRSHGLTWYTAGCESIGLRLPRRRDCPRNATVEADGVRLAKQSVLQTC